MFRRSLSAATRSAAASAALVLCNLNVPQAEPGDQRYHGPVEREMELMPSAVPLSRCGTAAMMIAGVAA